MALKRKRSSPTLSSPASDTSSTSAMSNNNSLQFYYAHSKPTEALYQKPTWSFPTYTSSDSSPASHLGSRTRKRHRDDRPDSEQVYANTMARLYAAQRERPRAEPMPSQQSIPSHSNAMTAATVMPHAPLQKTSLHAFWQISQQPPPTTVPMAVDVVAASGQEMKCDDCDRPLRSSDAMDVDDGTLEDEVQCYACHRSVCDSCAVLGNARICLACASG